MKVRELNIRIATVDDLIPLAELARTTFVQAFGQEMEHIALQQHLEENMSDAVFSEMIKEDLFFIVREGIGLVGFVQVGGVNADYARYVKSFETSASQIKRLYLLADRQQNGIGLSPRNWI